MKEMINYIDELNSLIKNIERPKSDEVFPNIFIFGVPRSGTTLLSQVLVHCLDVGYVNNLTARFYNAPFLGAVLTKELSIEKKISFNSSFGRTPLISDPHEFGYFWSDVLGFSSSQNMAVTDSDPSKIKLDRLKEEVIALNKVWEKPCVFKNVLTGLFVKEISSVLKRSIFIYIERDLIDNAISILKVREKLYGDKKIWWSLKPKKYSRIKDKSPEMQVIAQVCCLQEEFKKRMINMENVLRVEYRELCEKPMHIVSKVKYFVLKHTGFDVKIENKKETLAFKTYNKNNRLEKYLKKIIEGYSNGIC